MASTVEFSELIGQYVDDVFSPFPSSPEQVAVFSPGASSPFDDGETDIEYFNSFELKSHSKPENIGQSNLKRKAVNIEAIDSVPQLPRKKQALIEQDTQFSYPLWNSNELASQQQQQFVCPPFPLQQQPTIKANNQIQIQQLQQMHLKKIQQQQQQQQQIAVQPSSITPSRIKSTTPNLKLLFSLFDVLENDVDEVNTNTLVVIPTSLTPIQQQQQQQQQQSSPLSRSPSPSFSRSSSPSSSSSCATRSPSPYYEEQQSSQTIYINSQQQQQQQQSSQYSPEEYSSSPVSSPPHCVPEFVESSDPSSSLNLNVPNMFFSVTTPTSPTFSLPLFPNQRIAAGQY